MKMNSAIVRERLLQEWWFCCIGVEYLIYRGLKYDFRIDNMVCPLKPESAVFLKSLSQGTLYFLYAQNLWKDSVIPSSLVESNTTQQICPIVWASHGSIKKSVRWKSWRWPYNYHNQHLLAYNRHILGFCYPISFNLHNNRMKWVLYYPKL